MGSTGSTKAITSKYSGDAITLQQALNSWGKNATNIKLASQGTEYTGGIYSIGLNDNAKAQQIINYVQGHTVKQAIFRGLENLSDADYIKYTTVGNPIDSKGLESWTTDKGIAVGHGHVGKSVVFVKQSSTPNARAIGNKAGTGTEKEVITNNIKGKIVRIEKDKYTTYVYVK